MIVCVCRAVPQRTILEVIEGGARCLESVGQACDAGTDCGSCHEEIEAMLEAVQSGTLKMAERTAAVAQHGGPYHPACPGEPNVISEATQAPRRTA